MDYVVIFFRDILDGPLYIVVSIISVILICSCIGYMAEQHELKKSAVAQFNHKYNDITHDSESALGKVPNQSSSNIRGSTPR